MDSLDDAFLNVIYNGLSVWELTDLELLGHSLGRFDVEEPFYVTLRIAIEVNAPDRVQARDRVAEWVRTHLPWHYAEYTLDVLDIPEGWDSA